MPRLGILFALALAAGADDRVRTLLEADGKTLADLAIRDRELMRARPDMKERFPDDEPHLLPAVRAAMDRPAAVSARVRATAAAAARAPGLLDALLAVQRYHRPVTGGGLSGGTRAGPDEVFLKHFPPGPAGAISEIARAGRAAAHLLGIALEHVGEEDRAHLRAWLPKWVGRSTDADRERARKGEENVEERDALLRCAAIWERVDEAAFLAAWHGLVRAVETQVPRLACEEPFKRAIRVEDDLGPIVLRGHGNDRGDADAFLLIDFGGDDEYRLEEDAPARAVRVVIDLAGNDLYLGSAPFAWGATLLGLSLHVDLSGDDDYRCGDFGIGCAAGGHAALWDRTGRDRYYGGLCSQGVGIFGTGVLKDDAGDDEYAAGAFCQGFGSTAGLGAILDGAGDDVYTAGRDEEDIWRRPRTYITFAQGSAYSHRFGHVYTDEDGTRRWRITGQIPGGCGLLFDAAGDDRYQADVFGQGSAYWYSFGALVDGAGDDSYRATWYGQGVGTHAAVGCVVDLSGNDRYHSRTTSQGCGHDFSAGILHDLAGDDDYFGVGLCQGASSDALSAVGMLIDEAGDDRYRCANRCWGYAPKIARKPDASPFAFFLDLGGQNRYEGKPAHIPRPGSAWRQGERGYGVDRK